MLRNTVHVAVTVTSLYQQIRQLIITACEAYTNYLETVNVYAAITNVLKLVQ